MLTSRIVTAAQFRRPWHRRWVAALHEADLLHRKTWEYCYIAQALWERDMLRAGRRGLGFGVGREPLCRPSLPRSAVRFPPGEAPVNKTNALRARGIVPLEEPEVWPASYPLLSWQIERE